MYWIKRLNKKTVEKDESETNFLAKIRDQSEVIAELTKENLEVKTNSKDMDDKIKELSEKIDCQEAVIQKFKVMLKCDKCDFRLRAWLNSMFTYLRNTL